MVQRNKGQSAVAAAAYRSGSLLIEESTGIAHDYTRKRGVEHSEILAPDSAPPWVFDRETLWNAVEQSEKRKDAQVAREIEVGLPVELSNSEQLALLRDYAHREFVSKGMVADVGIHRDNPVNPHAHILLTTRDLTPEGFGPKNRSWNDKAHLMAWRSGWEDVTNEHLAEAGLALRIDHRSYHEQKLDLIPGRKLGLDQQRQQTQDLPGFLADRVAEQHRIAQANGLAIIQADGKTKRPYYITANDQEIFGFAGLWDRSKRDDGSRVESCTIITMPASKLMSEIHNAKQRMPAILAREDRDAWLKGAPDEAFAVLKQYPDAHLVVRPVSTRVNAPKNNDATLIEPIAA